MALPAGLPAGLREKSAGRLNHHLKNRLFVQQNDHQAVMTFTF